MTIMQFTPIPTIQNGDCLFAAYAIAAGIKGKPEWGPEGSFPMWQSMSAIKLRQMTTEFMRRSNQFMEWVVQGNHIDDFVFSADDHAAIMGALDRLKKSRNVAFYEKARSSYDLVRYDAPRPPRPIPVGVFKQIIDAYSTVMGLPGIWAGNLEIKALAILFRRDIYVKTVGRDLNLSQVVTITNRNNDMLTFDPDVGMTKVPRKGAVVYMLSDGTYTSRGTHFTALRPIIRTSPPDVPINTRGNTRQNNGPRNNARRNNGSPPDVPINTRGNTQQNNGPRNNARRNNGSRNGMSNNNAQRRRTAVNAMMRQQQQQQQQQEQRDSNTSGSGVGSMTTMYVIAGAVSVLLSSIRAAF